MRACVCACVRACVCVVCVSVCVCSQLLWPSLIFLTSFFFLFFYNKFDLIRIRFYVSLFLLISASWKR